MSENFKFQIDDSELPKLKSIVLNPNVVFVFEPSAKLRWLLIQNEEPEAKAMPLKWKDLIIKNEGFSISGIMVYDFLLGQSGNNEWVLTKGNIRVVHSTDTSNVNSTTGGLSELLDGLGTKDQ